MNSQWAESDGAAAGLWKWWQRVHVCYFTAVCLSNWRYKVHPLWGTCLTYLTAFEHAGSLTCSWQSLAICNLFACRSLLKECPGGCELVGAQLPDIRTERRVCTLLGPVLACMIQCLDKQEWKLLQSSEGQVLSSLPSPLSHATSIYSSWGAAFSSSV